MNTTSVALLFSGVANMEGKCTTRENIGTNYTNFCIVRERWESKFMINYQPIGVIRSPFKEPKGTPIQPTGAQDIDGVIEVYPEYAEGLKDVEGFSHLILLYHFHLIKESSLLVEPFLDNEPHGIFATRAPGRPNAIGLSVVRLIKVEGHKLQIRDVDIVDGTLLLDIKPYVPDFDVREGVKSGWFAKNIHKLPVARDDGRFTE